jgi:hypothetical protein
MSNQKLEQILAAKIIKRLLRKHIEVVEVYGPVMIEDTVLEVAHDAISEQEDLSIAGLTRYTIKTLRRQRMHG